MKIRTDKQRIDALQGLTKGYGKGWILRDSLVERGMRLYETSQEGADPDIRKAIDKYLDELEEWLLRNEKE